jgi:DNA-directed RNA polymerase specialized sigma24 family protein
LLGYRQKQVVQMHVDGLALDEIALYLDSTVDSVRRTWRDARARLAQLLKESRG